MTPKEKAEELVNKYYQYFESNTNAKECALITVDEILLIVNETLKGFLDGDIILYWLLVKKEIEKL